MSLQALGILVQPKNIKFGYIFPLAILLASTLTQLITFTGVYAYTDDYPSQWKNIAIDSTFDSWGEYNRECTSFAAWRLHSRNGFEMPFHANAYKWGPIASSLGYSVNSTSAKGAVAWSSSGLGHVAWVESVSADKSKVTLEEYNEVDSNGNKIYGDDGTYSERTVAASAYQYIHFKDIQASPTTPSYGGINATFIGNDQLVSDEVMWSGQYILSQDALYVLVMQGDGNLVLYGGGMKPMWSSGTAGKGGNRVVMQSDGNLVIYTPSNKAVWASNTAGRGDSTLYVQDDGNVVIYNNSWSPTWNSRTGGHSTLDFLGVDRLYSSQVMYDGQYIKSEDGRHVLLLQNDGNLVLYGPGYHVLWNSSTGSQGVAFAIMQSDGNFVLYTSSYKPVWSSKTAGYGSSFAVMQNDGNFVIYTYSGMPTWNSGTAGKV